jgi:hypothetical protein
MNISSSVLENTCSSLLQRNVNFIIKNKIIKKGKIELFVQRNFYLVFHILTESKKKEKFEIPIPFSFENHEEDGLVYFDYRFKTISKYYPESLDVLQKIFDKNKKNNKFGDSILMIETIKHE